MAMNRGEWQIVIFVKGCSLNNTARKICYKKVTPSCSKNTQIVAHTQEKLFI